MDFYNLQKEYKQLMGSIKPLIGRLKDSNDASLCFIWLSKIDEIEDKSIRNEYLMRLRDNVLKNHLKYPFSESPPDGPLQLHFQEGSTIPTETPGVDSLIRDMSPEIEKYKERSRKYRKQIVEYNSILRAALQSNQSQKNGKNVNLRTYQQISEKPYCRCEEQGGFTKRENDMTILTEKNEKLTKENESLRQQYQTLEQKLDKINGDHSRILKSKKKSRHSFNKMEESFRTEVQTVVDKKNETIRKLELLLNETTKNSSVEILQTMEEKYNELEKRYQDKLNNVLQKHKKESIEYREKIEKLQNLLILNSKVNRNV